MTEKLLRLLLLLLVWVVAPAAARPPGQPPQAGVAPLKTRNVVLITLDGLRWQEVFGGADERLFTKDEGVDNIAEARARFWRDTPEARREALMPFTWSVMAKEGQLLGNLRKGCGVQVANDYRVSYPGYSEIFCGFPNPYIKDNKRIPNPEVTVFEWLHGRPGFAGRVAAFGAWDLFPQIFNTERCGFPVDDGVAPITAGRVDSEILWTNTLRREIPRRFSASTFDALLFRPALEWIRLNKPRLVFLGLGETDEWAHAGEYDEYLAAARRADGYIQELWTTLQSMPEYRGSTTFIITCDHGRGGDDAPGYADGKLAEWRDHNAKVVGAQQAWIAVLGPDTPGRGERENAAPVTQSQIAATIAALLGEDYNAAQPRAGRPIGDVLTNPGRSKESP